MANPPDELALLEAAVDRFSRAPLPEDGPSLASFLHRVQRASDRISVKFSQGAAAFAETDEYDQQGSLSPLHWIRVNCNLTSGAAGDQYPSLNLAISVCQSRLPVRASSATRYASGVVKYTLLP